MIGDQSPGKTGRGDLNRPFRHGIDKPFSFGSVTEDVWSFDPSADDVIQYIRLINACFMWYEFLHCG